MVPRRFVSLLVLLAVGLLAVPAIALAAGGGGSAGDQQYTDPFSATTTATQAASTPSRSTPTTTMAASAPRTTSQMTSTPSDMPTSTVSATTVAAPVTASSGEIPFSGYPSAFAALLGFTLVAGGFALRVRSARP